MTEATNFSAALKVWGGTWFSITATVREPDSPACLLADINLHELQKTLDKQGIEIVENQKENMVGRKKLAEQTRGTSDAVQQQGNRDRRDVSGK